MDPLYDFVAPTRQGYVTVPLYPPGACKNQPTNGGGPALADGPSLFFEVFSPPPKTAATTATEPSAPAPASLLPPLCRGRDPCDKVVLLMGAFCTRRMFEPLAAELARRGFHALVFDHRGVGASSSSSSSSSTPPPGPPPSARLLAADALAVADHVFGGGSCKLHVLGASMGGMVACELAVLLARGEQSGRAGGGAAAAASGAGAGTGGGGAAPSSRLASLTVMVSCRGLQPALWRALGIAPPARVIEPIVRWLFPVPPPPPSAAAAAAAPPAPPPPMTTTTLCCPAVARVVESLMRDIVCPRLLGTPYPDQRRAAEFAARLEEGAGGDGDGDRGGGGGGGGGGGSGPPAPSSGAPTPNPKPVLLTYRDAYRALWTSRFHELFCFGDPSVGAAHTALVLGTRLSARKAAVVASCGAPVLSLVAERDAVVAPRAQRELARMLGARVLSVPTGHVGLGPWQRAFYDALDETLRAGRVAMAAAEAGLVVGGGGGGGGGATAAAAAVAVRA